MILGTRKRSFRSHGERHKIEARLHDDSNEHGIMHKRKACQDRQYHS